MAKLWRVGDQVISDNTLWSCIQAHEQAVDKAPGTGVNAAAYWEALSQTGSTTGVVGEFPVGVSGGVLDDSWFPSTVVRTSDTRLTDARVPLAHKASHATGGSDQILPADIGAFPASGVSSFGATLIDDANAAAARTTLGLGTAATSAQSDFAAASHNQAISTITYSGLTAGQVLRASGSTTAVFASLTASDVSGVAVLSPAAASTQTITAPNHSTIPLTIAKASGNPGSDASLMKWSGSAGGDTDIMVDTLGRTYLQSSSVRGTTLIATGTGNNVVGVFPPSAASAPQFYRLPATPPTTGQVLAYSGTETLGARNLVWNDAGAGGGGSVTSVGLSLPAGLFTVSGSPVTGTGTLTASFASVGTSQVLVGPNSGSGIPTLRVLDHAELSGRTGDVHTDHLVNAPAVSDRNLVQATAGIPGLVVRSKAGGYGNGSIPAFAWQTADGVNQAYTTDATTMDDGPRWGFRVRPGVADDYDVMNDDNLVRLKGDVIPADRGGTGHGTGAAWPHVPVTNNISPLFLTTSGGIDTDSRFNFRTDLGRLNLAGSIGLLPPAASGTIVSPIFMGSVSHTAATASTEAVAVSLSMPSIQFATGTLSLQRSVNITAPTYSFVGASTITRAATVSIAGAPVAGTNATITSSLALDVVSGNVALQSGRMSVSGTSAGTGFGNPTFSILNSTAWGGSEPYALWVGCTGGATGYSYIHGFRIGAAEFNGDSARTIFRPTSGNLDIGTFNGSIVLRPRSGTAETVASLRVHDVNANGGTGSGVTICQTSAVNNSDANNNGTSRLTVVGNNATQVTSTIRMAASQTADAMEILNSGGTAGFRVTPTSVIIGAHINLVQLGSADFQVNAGSETVSIVKATLNSNVAYRRANNVLVLNACQRGSADAANDQSGDALQVNMAGTKTAGIDRYGRPMYRNDANSTQLRRITLVAGVASFTDGSISSSTRFQPSMVTPGGTLGWLGWAVSGTTVTFTSYASNSSANTADTSTYDIYMSQALA